MAITPLRKIFCSFRPHPKKEPGFPAMRMKPGSRDVFRQQASDGGAAGKAWGA